MQVIGSFYLFFVSASNTIVWKDRLLINTELC